MSYVCDGRVFTGDVLFIRDAGRTDFQEGSPEKMFDSVTRKLFSLPDSTQVYPAHDYKGQTSSTIAEEKAHNTKFGGGKTLAEFKEMMAAMKLGQPKKIHIAVPANMKLGEI
jgi:glyoxylase-like metal-dependent hydrolase (beta-lactamase superfamily II)